MKAGGGILSFELKGGQERGKRFIDANENLTHGVNLGDTRTIITHPASTTHCKLSPEDKQTVGITEGLIRVSCGLEHSDDIIQELDNAIEASK
jgi:O-succinylhomoserine sulfhydrylase